MERTRSIISRETDGYISVSLLVQPPVIKAWGIDKQIIELILRCPNTRIATDATRTRVRAIQGHSLPRFLLMCYIR